MSEQDDLRKKLRENYSERAVDHMLRPKNMRRVTKPDGYARVAMDNGEMVEFFLTVSRGAVTECAFQTDGCAATLACASAVSELAERQDLNEVLTAVTAERILQTLGGLPEGNVHCAHRVAEAFRQAVADGFELKAAPWKKLYRKV